MPLYINIIQPNKTEEKVYEKARADMQIYKRGIF